MYTIIIPARVESTRLPGKVLLDIHGKCMLQRVYEQCLRTSATRIVIASDNMRVQNLCKKMGCEYVETSSNHPNGTSRLEEATRILHLHPRDVVVNVQADEPFINPDNIDKLASILVDSVHATFYKAGVPGIATLAYQTTEDSVIDDPNNVKVVKGADNTAIFFSRSRIPCRKAGSPVRVPYWVHLGIYVYRVAYLHAYANLPECPIERVEGLEQLRAVYNGHGIIVGEAENLAPVHGIDTSSDLVRAIDYAIQLEK